MARALSYLKWLKRRDQTYKHTIRPGSETQDPLKQLAEQCRLWNRYVEDVLAYSEASAKCMFLKYEDLVKSPQAGIENILRFLELDPTVYPYDGLERVSPDSIKKWAGEMNRDALELINRLNRDYLEKFQYMTAE
jgi:hypothetical protein